MTFDDQSATKHNWTLNTGIGGPLILAVSSGSPMITVGSGVTSTLSLMKKVSATQPRTRPVDESACPVGP